MSQGIVVVDVDPGVDDAFALLVLFAAHKLSLIRLAAVTCSAGNVQRKHSCRNVASLVSTFNIDFEDQIEFFEGAKHSLIKEGEYDGYFGLDGLGDVTDRPVGALEFRGTYEFGQFMANLTTSNPNEVTIMALGPLTLVSILLLQHPDIQLKDIWIMGGNTLGHEFVEWNFYTDPHSAHSLFKHTSLPVYVTTFQTCANTVVPMEWRENVLGRVSSDFMAFMNKAEDNFYNGNPPENWEMYDPIVAVGFVYRNTILKYQKSSIDVYVGCEKEEGLVVEGPNTVQFITEVDAEEYMDALLHSARTLA